MCVVRAKGGTRVLAERQSRMQFKYLHFAAFYFIPQQFSRHVENALLLPDLSGGTGWVEGVTAD